MIRLLPLLSVALAMAAHGADPVSTSENLRRALRTGGPVRLFHQASSEGSEDPFADPTAPEKIQVVHGFNMVELKGVESLYNMELLRDVISDPESLVPFPPEQGTRGTFRDFRNPEVLSWESGGQPVYALFSYERGEIAYLCIRYNLVHLSSQPARL